MPPVKMFTEAEEFFFMKRVKVEMEDSCQDYGVYDYTYIDRWTAKRKLIIFFLNECKCLKHICTFLSIFAQQFKCNYYITELFICNTIH